MMQSANYNNPNQRIETHATTHRKGKDGTVHMFGHIVFTLTQMRQMDNVIKREDATIGD
jgi:hypothetical protein